MTTKKANPQPEVEVDQEPEDGIVGGFPVGAHALPEFTAEQYDELAAAIPGASVAHDGKKPVGITVPYPLAQRLRQ